MERLRVKWLIQFLAGVAVLVLAIVYLVTRPSVNGDLYLAWGLFAAGVGLIAEVLVL